MKHTFGGGDQAVKTYILYIYSLFLLIEIFLRKILNLSLTVKLFEMKYF